ncbi:Serine/threonine-protein kinase TAO3 [Hibiscus syriacus]|uniref:Serine/threonine-protein kinase TAO3 n=1 Tax=Hibiscus syriacus TaxID=106335 RepID=A0A6A3AAN9_HIBSY|nr:protein PLASTID REDOX INSENSITIVE 2, chloroplastic-like [Hibiscus syriacus]KAE8701490.1 Serine/threonine-protein kinase TAO3 [Hibiscus syriacus]
MAPSSCSLVYNPPPFTSDKTSTTTILTLRNAGLNLHQPHPLSCSILSSKLISVKPSLIPVRASHPQRYVYPNPIPEFAEAETRKFKNELFKKLSKDRDKFGDDLDAVIDVCVEVFNNFLHNEYGGPGTLLVEPFTDMFVALKEKQLPGAPVAARASLLWAQNHVDHDWEVWHSNSP